jgi:hypothetical protein
LERRTGDADEFFGAHVEWYQFGVIERPVGSDAETALHFHRIGVKAVGLTSKMECGTSNAADMMVLFHPPSATCNQSPQAFAPRHQQRLDAYQFLARSKGD